MFKDFLKRIGSSSSPLVRLIARLFRFGVKLPMQTILAFRKSGPALSLVRQIERERGFMMWPDEMAFLYASVRAAKKLGGDFAEVGVSSGGSARLVCELKGERPFHLFDTFEGLPQASGADESFKIGQYKCSIDSVRKYLAAYPKVFLYQGLFPETGKAVSDKKFSYVHLDVDLYQSTFDSLMFFYPRMEKGGCIISHDYSTLRGVKQAFDEFFSDKPELVIELPTSQCLVVKG